MPIDVETLLQPVSPDKPCGINLDESFDADFAQVRDMIAESVREGGMVATDEEEAAGDVDWRGVRDRCVKLLTRTKDVRVVTYLALALLKLEGLQGLRDGLRLLREMLERYWNDVYPALDHEDNDDPTQRMNAVASLSPAGTRGDAMRFCQRLREVALCNSRLGRISLRDVAVANGQMEPADPNAPRFDPGTIEAAFREAPEEQLRELESAAAEAALHLSSLNTFLTTQVANSAPNLQAFSDALGEVHGLLRRHLDKRGGGGASDAGAGDGNGQAHARPQGGRLSGEIHSGDDVLMALDKICRYYEQNEKSSPVPLFLHAAKRMVFKSFLDIYDTLTPDAVQQLRAISAAEEKPA